MEFIKVESSNIDSLGWSDNVLAVKYKSGLIYTYANVPEDEFNKILSAKSKGKFMNESIKNKYQYKREN